MLRNYTLRIITQPCTSKEKSGVVGKTKQSYKTEGFVLLQTLQSNTINSKLVFLGVDFLKGSDLQRQCHRSEALLKH